MGQYICSLGEDEESDNREQASRSSVPSVRRSEHRQLDQTHPTPVNSRPRPERPNELPKRKDSSNAMVQFEEPPSSRSHGSHTEVVDVHGKRPNKRKTAAGRDQQSFTGDTNVDIMGTYVTLDETTKEKKNAQVRHKQDARYSQACAINNPVYGSTAETAALQPSKNTQAVLPLQKWSKETGMKQESNCGYDHDNTHDNTLSLSCPVGVISSEGIGNNQVIPKSASPEGKMVKPRKRRQKHKQKHPPTSSSMISRDSSQTQFDEHIYYNARPGRKTQPPTLKCDLNISNTYSNIKPTMTLLPDQNNPLLPPARDNLKRPPIYSKREPYRTLSQGQKSPQEPERSTSQETYRIFPHTSVPKDKNKLMIGIDVGSSTSGYAYTMAGSDDCYVNKNWAEHRGYTCLKAPTAYCRYRDQEYFGFEAFEKYEGFMDELDAEELKNVLFHQSAFNDPYDDDSTDTLVQYVRLFLVNHCCEAIRQQYHDFSHFTCIRIILTIGTNWQEMCLPYLLEEIQKRAAELTGIRRVEVDTRSMTECELRYCLVNTQKTRRLSKEQVLLISTGGRHIEAKLFMSKGQLRDKWECIYENLSNSKGGQYIDNMFMEDLEKLLGQDFIQSLTKSSKSTWIAFMECFNHAKNAVGPKTTLKVTLPLTYMFGTTFHEIKGISLAKHLEKFPDSGFLWQKDGKLSISGQKMKSYFSEVLEEVKNMVHHLGSSMKVSSRGCNVYFIGGLAESPLVKSVVAEEVSKLRCEVIIPEISSLCGAKGTLLCSTKSAL